MNLQLFRLKKSYSFNDLIFQNVYENFTTNLIAQVTATVFYAERNKSELQNCSRYFPGGSQCVPGTFPIFRVHV